VEVPRHDAASGVADTELVTPQVAGDRSCTRMCPVPNVVLTESGRVGGLDLRAVQLGHQPRGGT